jgi:hypothetical protein
VDGILRIHPSTRLRVSCVVYRDYDDAVPKELIDFLDLPAELEAFKARVGAVKATGGGDVAEDVFTGLEALRQLSWLSNGCRLVVRLTCCTPVVLACFRPDAPACICRYTWRTTRATALSSTMVLRQSTTSTWLATSFSAT